MPVSVVVPTRDRPASLARCLAALSDQRADGLDIVVVDDGSGDRAALEAALRALPAARCRRGAGGGPAAARNLGAEAAEGEIICFTDDDCEPAPGWAASLAAAASSSGIAAGRTVAPADAGPAVLASQLIIDQLLNASLDATSRTRFAPTCNLAVTREVLSRLRFDERFPDAAGEDREWSARAVALGIRPRYEAAAVAVHRQLLGAAGFLRQQFRYGRGAARFRRFGPAGSRGLAPPGFYAGLIRAGFARGPIVGALVIAAQVATAVGIVAETGAALTRTPRAGAAD